MKVKIELPTDLLLVDLCDLGTLSSLLAHVKFLERDYVKTGEVFKIAQFQTWNVTSEPRMGGDEPEVQVEEPIVVPPPVSSNNQSKSKSYAVLHCISSCGLVDIDEEEYQKQLTNTEASWKCPKCGGTAQFINTVVPEPAPDDIPF